MNSYYDSATDVEISRERALAELRKHGCGSPSHVAEFFAECGECETYLAHVVLDFLGY